MNLKESFRYQNFLDRMMSDAESSILIPGHCLTVTQKHLKSKANPDATDITEVVEPAEKFYKNDDVIRFMQWLVEEKSKLTNAIGKAKASLDFDIDAAVETNKFRQSVNRAIKAMLRFTSKKTTQQGRDYKFNLEGNQVMYYYDIESESVEAYDRESAKALMRSMISEADTTSSQIDSALINTVVDYSPRFDVNESFEDVMQAFIG